MPKSRYTAFASRDMTNPQDPSNAHAETSRIERERCLAAVDAEPELPGDMPPEMLQAVARAILEEDTDFFIHALRLAVRMTKAGIRERILSLEGS